VTWTKVRLSCAIYSFNPSRGSFRQEHDLTSQIKYTDKLLCALCFCSSPLKLRASFVASRRPLP